MTQHIPFIDREQELARIDAFINEWGTRRVLCLDAPGGMGKTWLLRRVQEHYRAQQHASSPLIITDILDFDDPELCVPQNSAYQIAHMLDPKIFDPYLFVLHNWHRMEHSSMGTDETEQATQALSQTFVNCFNMVSVQQRVVLFMDTLDALEHPDTFRYMVHTGKRLDNMVLFLAGRNVAQLARSFLTELGQEVQIISPGPLSEHASTVYLQHKQEQMNITLEPALIQQLILLTEGEPILLNLAAAWAAQARLPAWLNGRTLEAIQARPEEQQQQRRQEFERLLLQHFVSQETRIGQLAMLMAIIQPVDAEMVSELLALSAAETEELFAEAARMVLFRPLPNHRLALHVHIRQIINDAVWPVLDPQQQQRRHYSMQIVAHLKHKIDRLTQQLASWSAARQGSASGEQEPAAERPFKMQQIIEQELWHYKAQELTHMLLVDTEAGLNTFSIMFDEATRSYTLRFRATLFTYIEPYLNMLPPEQRHVIESRRVEHLFDHGEYIQARQLAATLQEQHTFSPEQLVTMLIQQGNIEIRLGYLDQSVAHFDRALRICRMHSLNAELVRTLNARGWAYRNQGKHDQALTDYLEAYQLSLQVDDPEQTAWVLTNISFIGTLRGDRQAAYESCQTALKLWESSGSLRGKGAAYSTLGGFHVRFNEPDEAMHAYTQALDIFSREQDLDWLSLVRCGRAYAFQSLGEFDKAEEDLAWALEHGPVNLRPRILYSQGQISWSRGDLLLTRQKLEECRTFSQEIGDHFHDYKCFADLIELAWEFGEFDRWRTFAETLVQSYTNPAEADSIRLRASCLRKIGDLTMCEGDYDAALDFYKQGFPLLAEYEIHERYTIRSQMRQTDQRLRAHVPDATLHRLGHDMAQFWRSNMLLVVKYPEALLTFRDWERKGGIIEQPPLL